MCVCVRERERERVAFTYLCPELSTRADVIATVDDDLEAAVAKRHGQSHISSCILIVIDLILRVYDE